MLVAVWLWPVCRLVAFDMLTTLWLAGQVQLTVQPRVAAVALKEKLVVPSPCPPCQISKPASASSSQWFRLSDPRDTASLISALTSRLLTEVTPGLDTKEMIFQEACCP